MYFSPVERFAQETDFSKFGLMGILGSLLEAGKKTYESGKDIKDTIFEKFNFDNENKVAPQSGIMENMDRAESTDVMRALMAGYDNANMNPAQIDPNTQTAMSLKEAQDMLLSPDVLAKGLGYAQPYIQNLLPEGVNVDSGVIYDPTKPDDTYTGIKFTIPFSTG